ncbi:MAG: protein-L-isoaspartate(D-aspartate) O-methyltransferase [Candidatus Dadabacteria bacterium]|nr:MAG: protein-L-isoaspartate(D-aspartate) O-methyltransferase [Candidatus Dadabacteria bacterium]
MVETLARELPRCPAEVLEALERVPRHRFVDEALWGRAYRDEALPIGHGQTITKPSTVARMTAALDPGPGDRVLEVGTGSGYQAAVLAVLAERVFTVERVLPLAVRARARLDRLGIRNVEIRPGDGRAGWPDHAPFDAVLVTAAAPEVPAALFDQVRPGGRLVAPVGGGEVQRIVRWMRGPEGWTREELDPCRFVPLREGVGSA